MGDIRPTYRDAAANDHRGSSRLPDFFIIGAAKSGTTSLYSYLGQHPAIYLSPQKEPNYFLFIEGDPPYRGPAGPGALRKVSVADRKAYESLFAGRTDEIVAGEASHWYLYDPEVPIRIRKEIPEARFIAILRHPVDRAYATHTYLYLKGRETVADFSAALDLEAERIAAGWEIGRYLDRGYYARQLARFYRVFPKSRIRVYLYEDLTATPGPLLRNLLDFLEVPDSFSFDLSRRFNPSGRPKHPAVHHFYLVARRLNRCLRGSSWIPASIRARMRSLWEAQLERVPLDRSVALQLVEHFRDDIDELEQMIGRDLRPWLQCEPAKPLFEHE